VFRKTHSYGKENVLLSVPKLPKGSWNSSLIPNPGNQQTASKIREIVHPSMVLYVCTPESAITDRLTDFNNTVSLQTSRISRTFLV
jgi:hypothetical protein